MSLSSKKLNPEGSLMFLGSSVTRFFIQFKAIVLTLAPMSDQDRNSPYNINTISSRKVKTTEKNIN